VEPIASSAGSALRPAGPGAADASALLRQGRILAAEVLARSADGTVQLALGRHVVPAKTELQMHPGARFLVQVAEEAGEPVLHVLTARAGEGSALLAALRRVIGAERPLGELLAELARSLGGERGLPAEAETLARALPAHVARPGEPPSGASLRALILALGLGHEAALAAAVDGRAPRPDMTGLRGDLKALLLLALQALDHGGAETAREAVARALAGLEAEQLLNLARSQAGEPLVLSFPFPDGAGWATARLAVPREPEEGGGPAGGEPPLAHVALELELSQLGPLRADLVLARAHLSIRLTVASSDLARRIEPELERLRASLAASSAGRTARDGSRTLELAVRAGTPAEIRRGFQPLDITWLREHPLVDVAG
jgi:hypothetical protein